MKMGKLNLKELSSEKRSQIVVLNESGSSIRKIAQKMKIPKSTVFDTINRYKKTNDFKSMKRFGRKRITTNSEDKLIVLLCKRDRRKTAREIQNELNSERQCKPISRTTVRRRLKEVGLNGRVAVKKPLLRLENKKKRLDWAKKHVNWTIEEWNKVLFTDESKFEIFGSKRRVYVRRLPHEKMLDVCIIPNVKHGGGSVMVWGCFGNNKIGDLVRINNKLDKEGYHQILSKHAVPSGTKLIGPGFVMQQDNDPKHTSKLCKNYLNKKESEGVLHNMTWPSQSPDCNPIELIWDELDRTVKKMPNRNVNQLFENLTSSWTKIKEETFQKLIARMPRICKAVIQAKGGYFDETKI